MNSKIWICEAPHSTEYQLPFMSFLRTDRAKFMQHLQAIQPLQQANDLGLPFDAELIPDKLYWGRKGRFEKELPPLFHNAFTYLRADVAGIFRKYAMGQGRLREIELFQNDTTTPVNQKVFALVVGNAQETLDYVASDLEVHRNQAGRFILPLSTQGKTFMVRSGFEAAADIWVDPYVSEGFFLSDRLVQALLDIANPNAYGLVPVS
ncbi:hypothetical protein [Sulfitobacter sp. SK011]|uniref:hypothetical protein n=1 Tax=Sulfitobacter sp. SK011 TaxID=1389004 RepID=UPI000E0A0663|nr:hypothetical protein [Sulfitobacter sp. SK011]AXI41200.1 hypothetical protein C1J02_03880 [Sulfitobacter sp. SK011]